MNTQAIIGKTAEHIRTMFSGESSGHDWWHVYRVWRTAVRIGTSEKADPFVVELAALLHDIADWKFHNGDSEAGPKAARLWLENIGVEESVINHVCQIIQDISFKGDGTLTPVRSREGMVVQDADRLDAMGAIGIARAFAYGGYKHREIFNPDVPQKHLTTFEGYKGATGTTINHFYEKLLLLKNLMNTDTGKAMAEERHTFMEHYLERFFLEWEGSK
jgi:uncharacterized protein